MLTGTGKEVEEGWQDVIEVSFVTSMREVSVVCNYEIDRLFAAKGKRVPTQFTSQFYITATLPCPPTFFLTPLVPIQPTASKHPRKSAAEALPH